MSTHYETLGLTESATQDDIKKAYRSLASKNHPDKGGDTAKFQEIQAAYTAIETPEKREQYDAERKGMGQRYQFNDFGHGAHFSDMDINDIFRAFNGGMHRGSPFGQQYQPRRNKDLRIQIVVQLKDTLEAQTKTVSVQNTNGTRQTVEVQVPRGVASGNTVKYRGLGDDFFETLPRGDLLVEFVVQGDPNFGVHGIDLVCRSEISCLDAITGKELEITGLDGRVFLLTVPAGTQPGTIMRIKGEGLYVLNRNMKGNLLVELAITVPRNLTESQLGMIKQIQSAQ